MNDAERDKKITDTADKVTAIHQVLFGYEGKPGLHDMVLATSERSFENKNALDQVKAIGRWAGLFILAAFAGAFGWLWKQQ